MFRGFVQKKLNYKRSEPLTGQVYYVGTIQATELSNRNDAKFRELSLNFPKLADWLAKLPGSTGAGIFKQRDFSFAPLYKMEPVKN